jgi:hypothetical protein
VKECLIFIENQTFIENLSYLINNSHLYQSPCPPMLLRPRPKSPGVLDDYLESTVSDPDNYTYKHYVPSLVSVLWNSTIKEHETDL